MHVIVGLGNPGSQYERNRHNIGMLAVDEIHRRHPSFSPWRKRFQAQASEGVVDGHKVLLIKPTTYMNESGRSGGEAIRFFKLGPEDVTVIYDELDLPPGKVRIKRGGGAGGHNGIRSLDAHIGKEYRRVRLGIGHPGSKERVTGHVLGDFAKADSDWLDPLLEDIASEIGLLIEGKDSQFMNRLHQPAGGESGKPAGSGGTEKKKPASPGRSHIRQARPRPKPNLPKEGPLAEMLKGLLGNKDKD